MRLRDDAHIKDEMSVRTTDATLVNHVDRITDR